MTQTEQILLQAIQKSLWNTDIDFPVDTNWDAVLKEAEDQAVLGIIADAIPVETKQKNKSRFGAITAKYVRTLYCQTQLVQLMEKHSIPIAILKGSTAAVYYPIPAQRSMGDIDFIVPEDQYDKVNEILLENGYVYLSEHQDKRHKSYIKDKIKFEIHRYFSYSDINIEPYIVDGLKQPENECIDGNSFPILPRVTNGLVLLAHLIHHFKTGLGLRQLIDWMMYVNKSLDDHLWEAEFITSAKETGLTVAALIATRTCQLYLGLPLERTTWCKDVDAETCKKFMDGLLTSGNFGRKQGDGNRVGSVTSSFREKGIYTTLQISGEKNWGMLKKYHWLKPFAWVYQACRLIRKGVQSKQKKTDIMKEWKATRQRRELYRTVMEQKKGRE